MVFLLCRVGDCTSAEAFFKELEEDESLEGMVYCSPERIDEKLAVFQRCGDDSRYRAWVSLKPTTKYLEMVVSSIC